MSTMQKKTLTLTDRAADLLPQLAGKYHEQGALVSRLIEEEARRRERAGQVGQTDLPALRQMVLELMHRLEEYEHRGG